MLLALLQSFGFRAIRDTLADNPAAQERILGAIMMCLAIADVSAVVILLEDETLTFSLKATQ